MQYIYQRLFPIKKYKIIFGMDCRTLTLSRTEKIISLRCFLRMKMKLFAFAITVEDKVIGSIGIFRQGNIHRQTAELGYYIAEEYWGKGIMTEAVKQICRYVFDKSDIIRIYAEPFAYNVASCRVLEKAGFQYEGTLRSNAVKNGEVIDMKMYSLLKTEMTGIQ